MADHDENENGSSNGSNNHGSQAANVAGAAFTWGAAIAFFTNYGPEAMEALRNLFSRAGYVWNWAKIQKNHNGVVYLRKKAALLFFSLLIGHLGAMKLVSLQYSDRVPADMWSVWGWILGILEFFVLLLILYAMPVRPVDNYAEARRLSKQEFLRQYGPPNRSPEFMGVPLVVITLFGGLLFFIPMTMLTNGEGMWWFNPNDAWLGYIGIGYHVVALIIIAFALKFFGIIVGGVLGALVGAGTIAVRNAAAAGTGTVTFENAEQKIADYSKPWKDAGAWLGKIAGDPAVPILIIDFFWLDFHHFWTPSITIMALLLSGGWDFIKMNRGLDVTMDQQKKVQSSAVLCGLGFLLGLFLLAVQAFKGAILSTFAAAFTMSWMNFAILGVVFGGICALCIWGAAKLQAAWKKEQKEAKQPIAPSKAVLLLGVAAFLIGLPALGLFGVGVGRAMGYSVHQSAPSTAPTVLGTVDGNTFTFASTPAPTATAATTTTTTNSGTSTHHARRNTSPSTSGKVKKIKMIDLVDPALR